MSTNNPYQPPQAEVIKPPGPGQLGDPKSHGIGAGWSWIAQGFGIFKSGVGLWMAMVVVYMILMILLSFIPFINILLGLVTPIFTGGFMIACQRAEREGSFEFTDMFAGFKNQTGPLFMLGLIYIGMATVIMLAMGALLVSFGVEEMFTGEPEDLAALGPAVSFMALLSMVMFIPLAMGMWFAPALIVFHQRRPWDAFKLSLSGCMKNMLPFLLYGIIIFVFGILSAIPFGLGYLILIPVIIGSIYVSYRDIFVREGEGEAQDDFKEDDDNGMTTFEG